jgi:HEAT repeat protein
MSDIEQLISKIHDPKARDALVAIGAPVIEPLLDMVRQARHPFIFHDEVAEVLTRIEPSPSERLQSLKYYPNYDVRKIVALAWDQLAGRRAVDAEIERLNIFQEGKKVTTLHSLRNITDLTTAIRIFRKFASGETELITENDLVHIFRQMGLSAISSLSAELQDERVRQAALNILARLGAAGIEVLHRLLSDPSQRLREMVAVALGKSGDPLVIGSLVSALEDQSLGVRLAAIENLWRYASDSRVVDGLAASFRSTERSIRLAVMRVIRICLSSPEDLLALAWNLSPRDADRMASAESKGLHDKKKAETLLAVLRIPDVQAIRLPSAKVIELLTLALKDSSKDIRLKALELLTFALNDSPGYVHPVTLELISLAARGSSENIYLKAAELFATALAEPARDAPSEAVELLTLAMKDVSATARLQVLDLLAHAPWVSSERVRSRVIDLLTSALSESSPEVRLMAMKLLASAPDEPTRNVGFATIEQLIPPLDEASASARHEALAMLDAVLGIPSVEARLKAVELLTVVADDPSKDVRRKAIAMLTSVLSDPAADARLAAAESPRQIGDHKILQVLLAALRDPEPEVRAEAAHGLGHFSEHSVLEALIGVLISDTPQVRTAAAEALGMIGNPRAVDALVSNLGSPHADLSMMVRWALKKIGPPEALRALIQAVNSPDYSVRSRAVTMLGDFEFPGAVELLMACLNDRHPEARASAILSLALIRDPRSLPELERVAQEEPSYSLQGNIPELAQFAIDFIKRHIAIFPSPPDPPSDSSSNS